MRTTTDETSESYYKLIENAATVKRRTFLNCDEGNLVKTNKWNTLFVMLIGKKPTKRLEIKFINGFASSCIFLRLKMALTKGAKILQNYKIN